MARRREPCVELLDLQRARDSVSLTDVASHLDETIHHLVVFDTFGDNPQAEIVTQIDGGCHDHVIVGFEGEQIRSEPVSFLAMGDAFCRQLVEQVEVCRHLQIAPSRRGIAGSPSTAA